MYFGEKIVLVWIILSSLSIWREGLWANIDPAEGGSSENRWNTQDYCCVFWKSDGCWKKLQRENPRACAALGSMNSAPCYPGLPEFAYYECPTQFKGPEYADTCESGDEWPGCVMRDWRVDPTHKLYIALHVLSMFLLSSGMSFLSFMLITALTLI